MSRDGPLTLPPIQHCQTGIDFAVHKVRTSPTLIVSRTSRFPEQMMAENEYLTFDDPPGLSERLVMARKAAKLTQTEAAEVLGKSRPTLVAIEKGTRTVRSEELVRLAKAYRCSLSDLTRPSVELIRLRPHLRAAANEASQQTSDELDRAIDSMQRFAEDYRWLETLANLPLPINYPPAVVLNRHMDVAAMGEDTAIRERQRLGLGDQPLLFLRNVLEAEVGLRIIYDDLPSPVAGLFGFNDQIGGVVAINRKHPPERRRASLVHEYGHLLTDRYQAGVDYLHTSGRKPRSEIFVESFGIAFLMPATSVRRHYERIVNHTDDFQIADLCRLAHFYFVSIEAMTLRMEGLKLLPRGTHQMIREKGFRPMTARGELTLPEQPIEQEMLPARYLFLAVDGYRRGELSEGQLAKVLRRDRLSAREAAAQILGGSDDDRQVQSTAGGTPDESLLLR